MSFATLSVALTANIKDFTDKMKDAVKQAKGVSATLGSNFKTASRGLTSFASSLGDDYRNANNALKSHRLGLKDTARIVQGIMVSQAFYAIANEIRQATSALWNFNKELDYAQVTYSALFGDTKLANDFMSALQEHSIETIFDYQGLADASKKLLAYGIEYKNLMFIMEGLTNLGTMSGDAAALDRISLALGQIYTKGKLSAEEMRQLANAYVPITDIIKEKFNLSEADLERVGDLNLPAAEVINAIVDYANERFGSVGDAAMYTITGLEAKIVDTLKVVGSEMLKPLTTAYKSFLVYISNGLESIRTAFSTGGIGGIFEYLVPNEDTQKTIRIFLANIKNLFSSIMSLGAAAGQVFGNFMQVFVAVFNAVVPAITAVTNALANVISAMASSTGSAALLRVALVAAAAGFVVMRVQAMAALAITAVTKAVTALSKALLVLGAIIAKHPIFVLLGALGVALVGVSVSSSKANSSLSGLFDTLAGTGGSSSKDILQKTEKDIVNTNGALDQFNNRLEEGKQNADDFADSIGGAGSAAKKTAGLLSFDEVFKLNTPSESSGGGGSGVTGALEDLGDVLSGIGGIGDSLIPEIPDFSEYISDFVDSLFSGLSDGLKSKVAAGGWGSLIGGTIGALIGAALGNPILGAKIGTAAGGIAGIIFDSIEYDISNTGVGTVTGVLTAIGKALAGAGATSLGSIIKNAFTTAAASGGTIAGVKGAFAAIGGVLKTVGLKAILKGGLIGAAVGLVTDGIAHLLWTWLDEKIASADKDSAKIGQTIGSILGTVIGGLIGGPAGMLIGSAIGTFVGGFVGLFWEPIKQFFADLGNSIGEWFSDIVNDIHNWLDETGISEWAEDVWNDLSLWWSNTTIGFSDWCTKTLTGIQGWVSDTWLSLSTWWNDTTTGFSDWWTNTIESLTGWWDDTIALFSDWDSLTGDSLGAWWEDTTAGFSEWKENTFGSLSTWFTDTIGGYADWEWETKKSIFGWSTDTAGSIATWASDTYTMLADWERDFKDTIKQWASDVLSEVSQWYEDTWRKIGQWTEDTLTDIGNWVVDTYNEYDQWTKDVEAVLGGFAHATKLAIDDWAEETWTSISTWVTDTYNDLDQWATDVGLVLTNFFADAIVKTDTWLSNTWTKMSTWFAETDAKLDALWAKLWDPATWRSGWDNVSSWFNGMRIDISAWFSNNKTSVKNWWEALWDPSRWKSGWSSVKQWFNDLFSGISNWFSSISTSVSSWWDGLFDGKSVSVNTSSSSSGGVRASLNGHATGGIFNREHIARFAEGNKAEMIVPLENNSAMQPFVDAISNGIVSSLAPITASAGYSSSMPPLYVGTLIADDRGIRELYKKFEIIQVQENARRGTTGGAF